MLSGRVRSWRTRIAKDAEEFDGVLDDYVDEGVEDGERLVMSIVD